MLSIKDFEKIDIPTHFGAIEDGEESDSMGYVLDQIYTLESADKINWRYGASKMVFLLKDVVVKLPFNGYEYYSWDEDNLRYRDEPEFEYNAHTDYCAMEENIYTYAEEAGVECFFAKTKTAGYTKNGQVYYTSERADYEFTKDSSDYNDLAIELLDKYDVWMCNTWLADAIVYYGVKAVKEFLAFVKEMEINDLHDSNVGYRADGSPCLIDYSGYFEC